MFEGEKSWRKVLLFEVVDHLLDVGLEAGVLLLGVLVVAVVMV